MRTERLRKIRGAAPRLAAAALACAAVSAALAAPATLVIDDFEAPALRGWSAQPRSRVERIAAGARVGKGALKWVFSSNGKTRYNNSITKTFPTTDLSRYDQIVLWFKSVDPLQGRVGLQLLTSEGIVTLSDVHRQAQPGEWVEVRLDITDKPRVRVVRGVRLFCDGRRWKPGTHVFLLDELRADTLRDEPPPGPRDYGEPLGAPFSKLPRARQDAFRRLAEPPPLAQRRNPYSTPMYYLMRKGYGYRGDLDHKKRVYPQRAPKGELGPDYGRWSLDRNRPDWQEVILKDWAALGLTSTHLYLYPRNAAMTIAPEEREALADFRRLSAKYGLRIGMRIDFPSPVHPQSRARGWLVHPLNPHNRLERYLRWAREVAALMKGAARYYVIGDEYDFHKQPPELGGWNAELYVKVWTQVARAIRSVDPEPTLSMFAASSGHWKDALDVLRCKDYRALAGAVATNWPSCRGLTRFFQDIERLAPGMQLLSNGVGYCSSADARPRYPQYDAYARYNDHDQACMVAKNMYVWWTFNAAAAPYYIALRNWVVRGRTYPYWFGFFGFEDFVVDEQDRLTIKHYPAWSAFQTIAQTFHDRPAFRRAPFAVKPVKGVSRCDAWVRGDKELVLILWQDYHRTAYTDVRLASPRFKYAVRVNLFDYRDWRDAAYTVAADAVTLRDLRVGFEPTIVWLFLDGRFDAARPASLSYRRAGARGRARGFACFSTLQTTGVCDHEHPTGIRRRRRHCETSPGLCESARGRGDRRPRGRGYFPRAGRGGQVRRRGVRFLHRAVRSGEARRDRHLHAAVRARRD